MLIYIYIYIYITPFIYKPIIYSLLEFILKHLEETHHLYGQKYVQKHKLSNAKNIKVADERAKYISITELVEYRADLST